MKGFTVSEGLFGLLRYASYTQRLPQVLTYDKDMDASYTQCPSIQDRDASPDARDASTRWRGHTARKHIAYNG